MSPNDRRAINESLRTTDLFSAAKTIPEISRFVEAIERARLRGDVQGPDFRTLFAPTNEALGSSLPHNGASLVEFVGRHIAIGSQTEADLRTTTALQTLAGRPIPVEYRADGSTFGGARIIRHDIPCVNGHIHVIDAVVK